DPTGAETAKATGLGLSPIDVNESILESSQPDDPSTRGSGLNNLFGLMKELWKGRDDSGSDRVMNHAKRLIRQELDLWMSLADPARREEEVIREMNEGMAAWRKDIPHPDFPVGEVMEAARATRRMSVQQAADFLEVTPDEYQQVLNGELFFSTRSELVR